MPSGLEHHRIRLEQEREQIERSLALYSEPGNDSDITASHGLFLAWQKINEAIAALSQIPSVPREPVIREEAPRTRLSELIAPIPVPAPAFEITPMLAAPADHDDLTRITGLDADLAQRLYDMGIRTFPQIANYSAADAQHLKVALALGEQVNLSAWISEAAQLARASHETALPVSETEAPAALNMAATNATETIVAVVAQHAARDASREPVAPIIETLPDEADEALVHDNPEITAEAEAAETAPEFSDWDEDIEPEITIVPRRRPDDIIISPDYFRPADEVAVVPPPVPQSTATAGFDPPLPIFPQEPAAGPEPAAAGTTGETFAHNGRFDPEADVIIYPRPDYPRTDFASGNRKGRIIGRPGEFGDQSVNPEPSAERMLAGTQPIASDRRNPQLRDSDLATVEIKLPGRVNQKPVMEAAQPLRHQPPLSRFFRALRGK
jgi:predicted flap endonuclease-1-like 5' DNA nuclease